MLNEHWPKLYIAGPDGFEKKGRVYLPKLISQIEKAGYDIINPWKLTDRETILKVITMPMSERKLEEQQKLGMLIGGNNEAALRRCDGVVANLDGVDMDSGTASEIGAAFILGKKIVGYRTDFRYAGDFIGSHNNVQVEYFVRQSGGEIVYDFADAPDHPEIVGLEEALRRTFG